MVSEGVGTARAGRPRRGLLLGAQYLVLGLAIVAAVVLADWPELGRNFAQPRIAEAMLPDIITTGLRNTVLYTTTGFGVGAAAGLVIALMRSSSVKAYRWLATAYIQIFRGLPALLIFIFVGVGVPLAFPGLAIPGGIIGQAALALGLVASAYLAETFRAGILAVPRGQVEAAYSLGMSDQQAMRSVILPQALRIMTPPLANELVVAFKDSSLVLFLGVSPGQRELSKFGQDVAGSQGNTTPIIVAGCCYLLVTVPLTILVQRLEARRAGTPKS